MEQEIKAEEILINNGEKELIEKTQKIIDNIKNNEYNSLKYRHENQTNLLQKLTDIDLRLFFGYLSGQFIVASFVVTNSIKFGIFERIGIFLIDIALTFVLFNLLQRNYIRRVEVTETVKNCNEALGYNENDLYLKGKFINAKTKFKPWFTGIGYKFGIFITFFGVILILFVPFLIDFIKNGFFSLYLK
jgi:hypothetical protein